MNQEKIKESLEKNNIQPNPELLYKWIENFLEGKGYIKGQRSVYLSLENKTDCQIIDDLLELSNSFEDYVGCFKSIEITQVGRDYNVTKLANGKIKTSIKTKKPIQKEQLEDENTEKIDIEF